MPESSPSILLIRLDAIGDALALTPLLATFRARNIPVDIVLSERNVEAFSCEAVRRRFTWPPGPGEQLDVDWKASTYSHALVATEDAEGYRIARSSGAPGRIGFDNGWGKPLKTLWVRSLLTQTLHRTAGLDGKAPHECEVLFRLGSDVWGEDVRPTRDVSLLRPLVIENEPPPDARVVFQVTDKWERLGISFEDVVACARRLVGFLQTLPANSIPVTNSTRVPENSSVRFIASSREGAFVEAFERATSLHVERFDALNPWKEAIAASRALVAPDSGAIHVAGMVGTPVAALFPPMRNFALQTARWSPWASPFRIIEASHDWPKRTIEALRQLI